MDYAINRTYDSKQGRFTQVDPIGMSASSLLSPQTLNLYAYCGNDPINYADPYGLFFGKLFKWISKILKIVAAVILAVAAVLAFSMGDVWSGIQLAMQSAQLWADISGNKILQKIVAIASIAVSIYRIRTQPTSTAPTFPFLGGGGSDGIDPNYLFIFASVGAIANSFAQTKDKKQKKRPGRFQTVTQIAVAFLQLFNPSSIDTNKEISVAICEKADGTLILSKVYVGTSNSSPIPDCPEGTKRVGLAHTHAAHDPKLIVDGKDWNETFGYADRRWTNNASIESGGLVPNFVATPRGQIKKFIPAVSYDSTRGTITTLKATTSIK